MRSKAFASICILFALISFSSAYNYFDSNPEPYNYFEAHNIKVNTAASIQSASPISHNLNDYSTSSFKSSSSFSNSKNSKEVLSCSLYSDDCSSSSPSTNFRYELLYEKKNYPYENNYTGNYYYRPIFDPVLQFFNWRF